MQSVDLLTFSSWLERCCRQEGRAGPQDPSQEVFLAFGRVFSGVLKDGQSMHVLSAAYNPTQPHLQRQLIQVHAWQAVTLA